MSNQPVDKELIERLGFVLASFERRNKVVLEGHLRVGDTIVYFKRAPRTDDASVMSEILKRAQSASVESEQHDNP